LECSAVCDSGRQLNSMLGEPGLKAFQDLLEYVRRWKRLQPSVALAPTRQRGAHFFSQVAESTIGVYWSRVRESQHAKGVATGVELTVPTGSGLPVGNKSIGG